MSDEKDTGKGAEIVRQGFAGKEIERRHETASTAIAAQARAEVEARFVMAMQRPRDLDNVRQQLLKDCERPNFAKRAYYSVPRRGATGRMTGAEDRVEGLSVRFVERAIQVSGNIGQATRVLYDDEYKRLISVSATDLETNATYSRDLIVEKTVEKSRLHKDDVVLETRHNDKGAMVFIIACTEAELLVKESNLVSRTFRTEAIRFVAPDTIDECEAQIVATVRARDAKDPDAARKEIADGFASLNVMPSDLKTYLGHDLGQCSPAQLTQLRGLWVGIRDGAISWAQVMAEREGAIGAEGSVEGKPEKTVAEKLADRAAAKKGEGPPGPQGPGGAPSKPAATSTTGPAQPSTPEPPATAQAKPARACFICGEALEAGVGVGPLGRQRHPGCSEPPADVKTTT